MKEVLLPFLLTIALIAWHSQFATANSPDDANGDGHVDIQDLLLVTSAFNTSPPSDARADTNGDRIVDIFDLVSVGSRFGWVQPVRTGDLTYDAGEPQNFDPRFFTPYKDVIKSKPSFPTMGNHDTYTAAGQPWLDAFYLPSNNPAGTERYYSFDYGNAHFVSLNVPEDMAVSPEQQTWLVNDLRSTTLTWKFVFFHVPPYSSSAHGNAMAVRNSVSNLLEGHGVDIVFNGHDHDYERTTTRKDYYPDGKGVVYVVTGGGGAPLYPAGVSPFTAYSASVFHVTQVQVNGNALTLRAVRADGTAIDTLTIARSPTP